MSEERPSGLRHKARPTEYAGVLFRSRLEASWAAFFDELGWTWEYEPYDLDGWTPDFIIKGKSENVFVEVKPLDLDRLPNWDDLMGFPELEKVRKFLRFAKSAQDPEKAEPPEVLILGNAPFEIKDHGPVLGLIYSTCFEKTGFYSHGAIIEFGREGFYYDFRSQWMSYRHRLSGVYYGGHVDNILDDFCVSSPWRSARNQTQWRPRISNF